MQILGLRKYHNFGVFKKGTVSRHLYPPCDVGVMNRGQAGNPIALKRKKENTRN